MIHSVEDGKDRTRSGAGLAESINSVQHRVAARRNEADCFLTLAKTTVERMLKVYNVTPQGAGEESEQGLPGVTTMSTGATQ